MGHGFWLSPAQEINSIIELGHPDLPLLLDPGAFCFPPDGGPDQEGTIYSAVHDREGLIRLQPESPETSYFPPANLVGTMTNMFHEQLHRILLPAFAAVVLRLSKTCGGPANAEERARKYDVPALLSELRSINSWIRDDPPSRSKSISAPPTRSSPRIELRIEHPPPHRMIRVRAHEDEAMSDGDTIYSDTDASDEEAAADAATNARRLRTIRDDVIPTYAREGNVEGLMGLSGSYPQFRAKIEEAVMQIVMERSVDDIQALEPDEASEVGIEADTGADQGQHVDAEADDVRDATIQHKDDMEVDKDEAPSTTDSPSAPPSAMISEKTRSSSEGTSDAMPVTPPESRQHLPAEVIRVADDGEAVGDTQMAEVSPNAALHATPRSAKAPLPRSLPDASREVSPSASSSSAESLFAPDRPSEKQSAPSPPDLRPPSRTPSPVFSASEEDDLAGFPQPLAVRRKHPPMQESPGQAAPVLARAGSEHNAVSGAAEIHNDADVNPWEIEYVVPWSEIPYIPPAVPGGVLAEDTILRAWNDARAWLRECRCTICERGKKRSRDEEQWWVQMAAVEESKKRRIF